MITRFNPTTNGDLHLGHIYMALVNMHMAHSTNSKFILRFDDNSRHIMAEHGGAEGMVKIASRQLDALTWMGVTPDQVLYQSASEEQIKRFLADSRFHMIVDHAFNGMRDTEPVILSSLVIRPQRISSWIIAERVVLDRQNNVDAVIRGIDLVQNHALYMYLCGLFGFRFPKCYYLPRLTAADGRDISKTSGNWKICDLKESGKSADELRLLLRAACLVDIHGPWSINNLRHEPRLS